MYFYEEKTKQGYRLFQSFQSAKKIVNRLVNEPFLIKVIKSEITDEEDGTYSVELRFYQLDFTKFKQSENIFCILSELTFSDLNKYKELVRLISTKSMNKFKTKIRTSTQQDERMMKALEELYY
ncbi:hypothetical protein [Tetragenococcus halophilus]|uniref:hypothetical protein n=1 Tax=Tetragenococcus halophilus TaxID=51669 RepID=UPI001F2740AF|nr:hypothetical protein [Tetragenococcus halophilus]MDN6146496.1 hypothetical protein [Tetragenococcus koreensis]MDN6569997.1 hypothetical protein [Staphylococcus equorum]MDN6730272.1 hypothetical protein [Alkalibacterium sp.]MCF1602542.1 hypothetical protein [Tetragenococcus halophilus]MDN6166406.1 hypothetical protein [Tetragenococcus koreensis]